MEKELFEKHIGNEGLVLFSSRWTDGFPKRRIDIFFLAFALSKDITLRD